MAWLLEDFRRISGGKGVRCINRVLPADAVPFFLCRIRSSAIIISASAAKALFFSWNKATSVGAVCSNRVAKAALEGHDTLDKL